ncbi:MAG: flagellar basal body-associated FliL family protein [Lachnospiraceae bacterium]|nr:flagellar basal body-associated FliL family protein [Lachnospiraceae bacterium]
MKKSILTIISFALSLVNLILTAVIVFAVVPEINNVNSLITKVAEAIELDISTGTDADATEAISPESLYIYSVNSGETMTINLKGSGDGEAHFLIVAITLSENTLSEKYETFGGDNSATYDAVIRSQINSVVAKYTINDVESDTAALQTDIKDTLNEYFGDSAFIVDVGFSSITYQ